MVEFLVYAITAVLLIAGWTIHEIVTFTDNNREEDEND